ncbi:cadherin domain-containing protein [Ditylenchus destructor]|nr:cadherin domain-containing protein [Ditylenchus destructor]
MIQSSEHSDSIPVSSPSSWSYQWKRRRRKACVYIANSNMVIITLLIMIIGIKDANPDKKVAYKRQLSSNNEFRYSERTFHFHLTEECPINTLIGQIPLDEWLYSEKRESLLYRLSIAPELSTLLTFNSTTGELRTSSRIDRETLPRIQHFSNKYFADENSDADIHAILVQDHETLHDTAPIIIHVHIFVDDINDNDPQCEQQYGQNVSISESAAVGTRFVLFSARDPDRGDNGTIINYKLVESQNRNKPSQKFAIVRQGAVIFLVLLDTVDREQCELYNLIVEVEDGGTPKRTGTCNVHINILDVNDNAPIFEQPVYNVNFTFSKNGSTGSKIGILKVRANDLDKGKNAKVSYRLLNGSGIEQFLIDEANGQIYAKVNQLNRSAQPCPEFSAKPVAQPYVLTVEAQDEGIPAFSSTAFVNVYLIGDNCMKAVETSRPMDTKIHIKTYPKGSEFASVNKSMVNGTIIAVFIHQQKSVIAPTNGETLFVKVREDVSVGSKIARVSSNFTRPIYEIYRPRKYLNSSTVFYVDPLTGWLKLLNGSLDVRQSPYTIAVKIRDKNRPIYTSDIDVQVEVLDVNNHSPRFVDCDMLMQSIRCTQLPESDDLIQPSILYSVTIKQNHSLLDEIFYLHATDNDFGENSRISYFLLNSMDATLFRVNEETGQVFLHRTLAVKPLQRRFLFDVIASDNGEGEKRTTRARVEIFLEDIDHAHISDNETTMKFVSNTTSVDVDLDRWIIGAPIASLKTEFHNSNEILYSIDSDMAKIDPITGVLSLRPVPYGVQMDQLVMNVKAESKNSGSEFIANEKIIVNLKGGKKSAPFPIKQIVDIPWTESRHAGDVLADLGLTHENQAQLYIFRPYNGEMTEFLDLFPSGEIVLRQPEYLKSTTFDVIIEDIVKRTKYRMKFSSHETAPPMCPPKNESEYWLDENKSAGTFIGLLRGCDMDEGANGLMRYELLNHTEDFLLDAQLGILRSRRIFDYENEKRVNGIVTYEIAYSLTDFGTPPFSVECTANVYVTDINDNAPLFLHPFYTIQVNLSNIVKDPDKSLLTVHATDADSGRNGEIRYFLKDHSGIFKLNSVTGELFASLSPEIERAWMEYQKPYKLYNLTMIAVDNTDPPGKRRQTAPAILMIKLIFDMPRNITTSLRFVEPNPATIIINEAASPGQILTRFKADTSMGTHQQYFIEYELVYVDDEPAYFQLDPWSGDLVLTRPLNEAKRCHWMIEVVAYNRIESNHEKAIIQTEVYIKRQNNSYSEMVSNFVHLHANAAVGSFQENQSNEMVFCVRENVPIGWFVGWIGVKNPDNQSYRYSILHFHSSHGELSSSSHQGFPFTIDESTGILTTSGPLDYENSPIFTFQVQVKYNDEIVTVVDVMVVLEDENDNPPVFIAGTRLKSEMWEFTGIRIREDTKPNTRVFHLKFEDQDLTAEFHATIDHLTDPQGLFAIDDNGFVTLISDNLDYEIGPTYNITVILRDSPLGNPKARLVFEILDVNDNSPIFLNPSTTFFITVSASIGEVIGKVLATDADSGMNGLVRYSIQPETLPESSFAVDAITGELTVKQPLNREVKSYEFVIEAKDIGTPSLRSQLNVSIFILAGNNTCRYLSRSQSAVNFTMNNQMNKFKISEDSPIGHYIGKFSYADVYKDDERTVVFKIVDHSSRFFRINPLSGSIFLARQLDFEEQQIFTLNISMISFCGNDKSQLFSIVTVEITDINDEAPAFTDGDHLEIRIAANLPGIYPLKIKQIKAKDPEEGVNGLITYSLIEGDTHMFQINTSTGVLSLNEVLHINHGHRYELIVEARDSGTPRLAATIRVDILVLDMNNHVPHFRQPSYYLRIKENDESLVGNHTKILKVEAVDKDAGLNGAIRYLFVNEKRLSPFYLDPILGTLHLRQPLDAETLKRHILSVQVVDSGEFYQHWSDILDIVIDVDDINDNAPVIRSDQQDVYVSDKSQPGDIIYTVDAYDPDATSTLSYTLTMDNFQLFSIDNRGIIRISHSGLLSSNRDFFKMQSTDEYFATVTVSDEDGHNSSIDLRFHITNCTHVPLFNPFNETRVSVMENAISTELFRFEAYVKPSAESQHDIPIRYSIASGDPFANLRMDPFTGQLFGMHLDREQFMKYELQIAATVLSSPPCTSYQPFTVIVKDALISVKILENQPPQYNFLPISKATDADDGENARISYSIVEGNSKNEFGIDAQTGMLHVLQPLDRETTSSYRLVIEARDNGAPSLNATCVIEVEILDENDNPPKFTRIFHGRITENAKIGDFVLKITSVDVDSVLLSRNIYSLENEDQNNTFNVHPITGDITVAETLDREKKSEYHLRVRVSDGTWDVGTTVTIIVDDSNDNPPIFDQSVYEFSLLSSDFRNQTKSRVIVGQVQASDADVGENARIFYALNHKQSEGLWIYLFQIDPNNGNIWIENTDLENLERMLSLSEKFSEINTLKVSAKDNGCPSHISNSTVIIYLDNWRANTLKEEEERQEMEVPNFGESCQTIEVREDEMFLNSIMYDWKLASNPSSTKFELVAYHPPVAQKLFLIDRLNGQVSVQPIWNSIKQRFGCRKTNVFELKIRRTSEEWAIISETSLYPKEVISDSLNIRIVVHSRPNLSHHIVQFVTPTASFRISKRVRKGTIVGQLLNAVTHMSHSINKVVALAEAHKSIHVNPNNGEIILKEDMIDQHTSSLEFWAVLQPRSPFDNSMMLRKLSRCFVKIAFDAALPLTPVFSQPSYNVIVPLTAPISSEVIRFDFAIIKGIHKMELSSKGRDMPFCISSLSYNETSTIVFVCSKLPNNTHLYHLGLSIYSLEGNSSQIRSRANLQVEILSNSSSKESETRWPNLSLETEILDNEWEDDCTVDTVFPTDLPISETSSVYGISTNIFAKNTPPNGSAMSGKTAQFAVIVSMTVIGLFLISFVVAFFLYRRTKKVECQQNRSLANNSIATKSEYFESQNGYMTVTRPSMLLEDYMRKVKYQQAVHPASH